MRVYNTLMEEYARFCKMLKLPPCLRWLMAFQLSGNQAVFTGGVVTASPATMVLKILSSYPTLSWDLTTHIELQNHRGEWKEEIIDTVFEISIVSTYSVLWIYHFQLSS